MLMSILDGTDRLAGQRAAHVLQLAGERYPHLLGPHVGVLLQLLDRDVHESVQRVAVRSLHYAPLAKRWKGVVFTRMLALTADRGRSIAQRAFAVSVAARIANEHRELKSELFALLQLVLVEAPAPAIRSRISKVLTLKSGEQ